MTEMTRKTKLAIIFCAIGAAIGIGVTIAMVYDQGVVAMFQRLVGGEEDDSSYPNSEPTLGYLSHYKAILAVGEEGTFIAIPSLENLHIHLNGNLAMVLP